MLLSPVSWGILYLSIVFVAQYIYARKQNIAPYFIPQAT